MRKSLSRSVSESVSESVSDRYLFSSGGGTPGKPAVPVRLLLSGQRAEEPAGQRRQLPLQVPGTTGHIEI